MPSTTHICLFIDHLQVNLRYSSQLMPQRSKTTGTALKVCLVVVGTWCNESVAWTLSFKDNYTTSVNHTTTTDIMQWQERQNVLPPIATETVPTKIATSLSTVDKALRYLFSLTLH